jgi:hypothetical protein
VEAPFIYTASLKRGVAKVSDRSFRRVAGDAQKRTVRGWLEGTPQIK